MTIQTTTHLNFSGDARRALEFYRTVFGGELTINTYADFGTPATVPGADLVVFGLVDSDSGFRIMAYDTLGAPCSGILGGGATRRGDKTTVTEQALFVSVAAGSIDELHGVWDALVSGGTVIEELAASAWSAGFGMVTDRFGVTWSLSVAA